MSLKASHNRTGQTDCAKAFHLTYIVYNVQITCIQLSDVVTFSTPRTQSCKIQTTTEMCLFLTDWGERCTQYKVKATSGSDALWCVWPAAAGDFLEGEFAADIIEEGIISLLRNIFMRIEFVVAYVLKPSVPAAVQVHRLENISVKEIIDFCHYSLYYRLTNNATTLVCKETHCRILVDPLAPRDHSNQELDNPTVVSFSRDSGNWIILNWPPNLV